MDELNEIIRTNEIIRLSLEKAKLFGILPNTHKLKEGAIDVSIKSVKQRRDEIVIKVQVTTTPTTKPQEKILTYNRKKLTPYEATFIGWAFLLLDKYKNKNQDKAKKFLIFAITRNINSCLPHYLLADNNLIDSKYFGSKKAYKYELYKAMEMPDVFPRFYRLLWRTEDNKIKSLGILKEGLQKFPDDGFLVTTYADHLLREGKYKESLRILRNVKPTLNWEYWWEYLDYHLLMVKSLVALRKFEEAEKFLSEVKLDKDKHNFLKGLFHFEKRNYKRAVKFFILAIEETKSDSCIATASLYYLLNCYQKEHNSDKIQEIVQSLPEGYDDFQAMPFHLSYEDIAEKSLRLLLKERLDELTKSKIKGFLAYLILRKLPNPEFENGFRSLTQTEKKLLKEGIKLVKRGLDYLPDNKFFNAIYSNLLYKKGDCNEAMKYNLKTLEKDDEGDLSTYVSLSECSGEFLDNYVPYLKSALKNFFISRYIEFQFENDVSSLYERKKYDVIVQLFNWLKNDLNLEKANKKAHWTSIGSYNLVCDPIKYSPACLFEIAYSLKEQGDDEQARYIYEKERELNGETSAVMNNLAIIYEGQNNLQKAKECIKKAKQLTKEEDEIVNRNYDRLMKQTKNLKKSKKNVEKQITKKTKPTFDVKTGKIIWGKKECQIPLGTIEFYLCKMVFKEPFGTRISETDIITAIDSEKYKEECPRMIYDAHRRINKRVKENLGITKLLNYGAASVWIRKEIFSE